MILGFGNNVVSSLASDITASQTTFSVLPGDGPLFAALLTSDFSNKSTILKNYAKITLTDSGETAFEVCHLTAVSGDTLTVIRGQEGTAAKGWALKDVVANFATRGSENAFPQIAHIQSGFYTSGIAGGTANALTLELPTTFFLNGSADWVLKTPIVVYPTQNNTGACTLQLTMGGRVLGTFPLYKGSKKNLVSNDLVSGTPVQCILDQSKAFFVVLNPSSAYNDQINLIYPIGIVTWFAANKNPNTLFPGTTWNYIGENKTIRLAAETGTDVMTTGGSDSATLAVDNLPPHGHTFSANTSSFDYGTATTSTFDYGTKQTDVQGDHAHSYSQPYYPSGNGANGSQYTLSSSGATTSVNGAHAHNVGIGAHNHTVGIGAHDHSVSGTTANTGTGKEFSVANSFIKLMGWYRSA